MPLHTVTPHSHWPGERRQCVVEPEAKRQLAARCQAVGPEKHVNSSMGGGAGGGERRLWPLARLCHIFTAFPLKVTLELERLPNNPSA